MSGVTQVYRGSMMGLPVAVKKLDETGLQGREQFFREVEVRADLIFFSSTTAAATGKERK